MCNIIYNNSKCPILTIVTDIVCDLQPFSYDNRVGNQFYCNSIVVSETRLCSKYFVPMRSSYSEKSKIC